MLIKRRRGWEIPESQATPEHLFLDRRRIVKAFAAGPILLAGLRVVPNAVRLGSRVDSAGEQSRLARAICRDHLLCLGGIVVFVAVQLCAALR